MKRAFWILIAGILSNAEGMETKNDPIKPVLKEASRVFRKICCGGLPLAEGITPSSKPHSVKFSE